MTTVKPYGVKPGHPPSRNVTMEDTGKAAPHQQAALVRLNLNGRVFDISQETCLAIPLLRETLTGKAAGVLDTDRLSDAGAAPTGGDCLLSDYSTSGEARDPRPVKGQTVHAQHRHKMQGAEDQPHTTLFFQRSVSVFEAILDYAQNGELHLASHVCPSLFARDLIFWGFDLTDLDPCCYPKVVSYLQEQRTVMKFHQTCMPVAVQEASEADGRTGSTWQRYRQSVWTVVTDPWSSVTAKVYFTVLCLVILASFFVMTAGTTTTFTRSLTSSEWQEYMGDNYDNYYWDFGDDDGDGDAVVTPGSISSSTTPRRLATTKFSPRALVQWLQCLAYVCTGLLTCDYLLRLLVCPSLRQFFTDVINISDAIALAASYAKHVIDLHLPEEKYEESETDVINVIQLLRVLRFLRPMSTVRGFRVIYFTLKSSFLELLLLFALLGFLVMIFSSLLYFLDDKTSIPNIPVGMWYALVTMTTVGYGDVVPQSLQGKLIGCVCAMSGVLFLAMTLPIVVNTFSTLYTTCSIGPPSHNKKKQRDPALRLSKADKAI